MAAQIDDLKSIRRVLGKSQSEMADVLGISVRAVQSYEQGWRPMPCRVQQLSALLIYLNWRRSGGKAKPCWKIKDCEPERRAECAASQYKAGDLCWLITGTRCGDDTDNSETKMRMCSECKVLQTWWPEA